MGIQTILALTAALLLIGAIAYLTIGAIAASRLTRPLRAFSADLSPAAAGLDFEEVRFPARDGKAQLDGWFMPALGATRVVVLVHGLYASRTVAFAGGLISLAGALHRTGFSVLMFDLRGHGLSTNGRLSFGLHERQDVLGAVDWLAGRGIPPEHVGLLGVSLGSASSIGAAFEEPRIAALVLDSGFAEILPVIRRRRGDRGCAVQQFSSTGLGLTSGRKVGLVLSILTVTTLLGALVLPAASVTVWVVEATAAPSVLRPGSTLAQGLDLA